MKKGNSKLLIRNLRKMEEKKQLNIGVVSKRNSKMREKIATFLINNGFNEDTEKGAENRSFFKDGLSSIDIGDEITFIGDGGDWLNIPLDYYAIIGALLHYRMIPVDYVY